MKNWKIIGLIILALIVLIGLDFGFGYLGVFKTKTVGKAQQNVQREVFEQTQSYVEGKRQEALKFYQEYNSAKTNTEKQAIRKMVSHSFANIEEDKIFKGELYQFIHDCKYGTTNLKNE